MRGAGCRPGGASQSVRALLLAALALAVVVCADGYSEELLLQPLPDGATMAHFEATAAAPLLAMHAASFPPRLLRLVRQHGVQEVELALTQGRWGWAHQQQHLGPAAAAVWPKPVGLQLKVAFGPAANHTEAAYAALTQALGGMLCAGIATVPQLAVMAAPAVGWFSPLGRQQQPVAEAQGASVQQQQQKQHHAQRQVYAWLAQEVVCSENLAAWRRLLPCRHHAGLAALLQPLQLAAARYYSLGIHLRVMSAAANVANGSGTRRRSSSQEAEQQWVELRHVLTAVMPRQAAAAAGGGQQEHGLLEATFGQSMPPACPAATASTLYLAGAGSRDVEAGINTSSNSVDGCTWQETPAEPVLACNASQAGLRLPAGLPAQGHTTQTNEGVQHQPQLVLQVVQHMAQRGSQAGTLVLAVRVSAPAGTEQQTQGEAQGASMRLHVMQLLPWQLMTDATSLQVELNGQALQADSPEVVWQSVDARPDRTSLVELLLRLPSGGAGHSNSSGSSSGGPSEVHQVAARISYRAAFVGVFDHAPDASRGVDIPPGVATLLPSACDGDSNSSSSRNVPSSGPLLHRLQQDCGARQAYSGGGSGSIVHLPLPDFSMPFNVTCFTSTLLAILFGGIANLALRPPEELLTGGDSAGASGVPVWKRKLRRVVALLLLMGVLAVYLDRDLQRQLDATLHHLLLGRTSAPEQHGEL